MKALVLGATGHMGNAFTRELIASDWEVSILSRQPAPGPLLHGLKLNFISGDLDCPSDLDGWVSGCDLVVDASAPYHLWLPRDRSQAMEEADRRQSDILSAIQAAGADYVFISSFTTRIDQTGFSQQILRALHPYLDLKSRLEDRVLEAAANGLRAVVVNPTMCLGPWDDRPLPFNLIALLLEGQVPASNSHPVNVIDVRDVALAGMRAREIGLFGQPLLLAGRNTSVEGLLNLICRIAEIGRPRWRFPAAASAVAAFGNELLSGMGLSALPYPSLGLLLLLQQRWLTPGPEQRKLDISLRPLSRTVADAVRWQRTQGALGPGSGFASAD